MDVFTLLGAVHVEGDIKAEVEEEPLIPTLISQKTANSEGHPGRAMSGCS